MRTPPPFPPSDAPLNHRDPHTSRLTALALTALLAATVNASSAGCRAKGLTAPASDGRPVDAANKEGRTALMFAAKYGQRDVAAYLLDEAAADPTLRMKNESSAFDWCANPTTLS